MVKNLPVNVGAARDADSVLGSGRSLKEAMATHSSKIARKIPRTEETEELHSMG